ncbi:MAG: ThiF family adenylyltransferase [bacterium]|nr:ThiF family adenylyltransferase [bacterium]
MANTPENPRYTRQRRLSFWDSTAQANLANAHAMIVGVGALGCPCADLLARAGVGRLTLIDRDVVDVTNLHRQTLYTDADARSSRPKAIAAAERLSAVNPDIEIHPVVADLNANDAEFILKREQHGIPDILIDGADNFETRYILNDLSVKHTIPYVYAGAVGTRGMATVFLPPDSPCLRCLFPEPPPPGSQPTCETVGVFSPVSSIIASYQASEALKVLMGHERRAMRSLLEFDLWEGQRRRIDLSGSRDPDCPCCAGRRFDFLEREDEDTVSICGKDAIQVNPRVRQRLDLHQIQATLSAHGEFSNLGVLVKGTLKDEPYTLSVFHDGRAIIEGVSEPALARSIYARYIGS